MQRFILPAIAALLLTACASQPEKTLEEKLAGKSPEERQEILRLECLNTAEHAANPPRKNHNGHRGHRHTDSADTKRLKDICREMNELEKQE